MTNDEAKSKQEETLNNLKKYNKTRKTEIVEDESSIQEVLELAPEVIEGVEESYVPPVMSHRCPYCGTMAYVGQIHGMGYCKEKVQYEQ